MRPARLTTILAATLAATVLAACGSATDKVSAPPTTTRTPLALVRTSEDARAAIYPQQRPDYVLDGDLADLGADAPVRTLVGADVTEADVARIAGILGLHGAPARTDWGWEVRDGDALLGVETSGGVTWLDYSSQGNAGSSDGGAGSVGSVGAGSSEPSTGAADNIATPAPPPDTAPPDAPPVTEPSVPVPTIPPPVDVPNADDAAGIAQSLLDDLGVLGDQQWAHDVTDTSTDVAVSCASDAPCPQPEPPQADSAPVTARTVTYELVLDGARVPSVAWNVTIGSHRKVEALSGTWARPTSAGTYPLRPTAAVFDDLRHDRAQYVGAQPLAAGGAEIAPDDANTGPRESAPLATHITGVSLGTARWDGTDGGHSVAYLVPTYRFHARVDGGSTYDVEVLALDPGTFTISGPTGAAGSGKAG